MSMENDPIVVTGAGLVTPVGHDSLSAAIAIRSGISRFQEIPGFATSAGAAYTGAQVYGVTDGRSGSGRLLSMAIPAAREALFSAEEFYEEIDLSLSRLLLSLPPSERPSYDDFGEADLSSFLEATQLEGLRKSLPPAGARVDGAAFLNQQEAILSDKREAPPSVEIFRDGNCGGITCLKRAEHLLHNTALRHCIVGAFDSLVEFPALAWLEEAGRVKTDDRPYGFIPGEAAAFLVLELRSEALRRGAPPLAEIMTPVTTREDATIFADLPLRGRALSEAIQATLTGSGVDPDFIICDLNGEYYRSKEWALAMGGVFKNKEVVPELWHPAENIGDVGAASAIVCAIVAMNGLRQGYFHGDNALVWTSSDAGGRGAVMVSAKKTEE